MITADGIRDGMLLTLVNSIPAAAYALIVNLFDGPSWAVAMTFLITYAVHDAS